MPTNQDLNSNLIKSLTSVHLPPPPSCHSELSKGSEKHLGSSYNTGSLVLQEPSQFSYDDDQITQKVLQPNIMINSSRVPFQQTRSKRKSETSDELQAPLNTPPHTISRSDSRPTKKSKTQVTPTMNQNRSKKSSKNPLSPQYSSPSSSNPVTSESVSKPPPLSFTAKPKSKKAQVAKIQIMEKVPSPNKMPKILHDSESKPPYSYATLIGMAILRGEDRKLTLSQIYSWISSTFKYYRKNDVGWQNSIRHNLSLNKAFIKTEKSSDGKGHYWEVVKGFEMQFIKGKSGKKSFGNIQIEQNDESTKQSKNNSIQLQDDEDEEEEKEIIIIHQAAPPSPKLSEATTAFKDADETSSSEDDDNANYSDDDDDNISRTPKSQIRSIDSELITRPSLKKSHTVIGLQSLALTNDNDHYLHEFGGDFNKLPSKKQYFKPISSTTGGSLRDIPSLQAPDTNWAASASGNHIIFGQVKPSISVDSPPRSTRFLSFPSTSSFSCNTNFELSPLKRQETGPLLEPLSPSSRLHESTSTTIQSNGFLSNATKTPLRATSSNSQNLNSGINSAQLNHFYGFLKTPNTRNIRTPNTNSIMKKFWNSPSLIDDFYTSPSIPRNSDDDYNYKVGLFGSPEKFKSKLDTASLVSPSLRKRGASSTNSQILESSNNYGVSELFGIDICSVVQRAVENEKNHKQNNDSASDSHDSNSTDDESETNVIA